MSIKPEIACAIIEGISSVREDKELQDFVVEVEGKEFKCHRLILSACSGFFRGLLRSGMKESQKQRTKLEGVSMETFTDILETLYTGCDNLTRDNMLNVWLAADQLQITVVFDNCVDFITKNICNDTIFSVWEVAAHLMHKNITELCTTFITNNTSLENWEIIYSSAKKLGSDLILSHVRDFIKKNYEEVIKSTAFLYLRENDLLDIIKSQDLVVCAEDVVIESILKWIKYDSEHNIDTMNFSAHQQENINKERKKCLKSLLSECRLYLISSFTLEKMSRDPLIMNNKRTKEMVMNALLYKSVGRQHGQSLKAAVHRRCSGLENAGVMVSANGIVLTLSCQPTFQFFELPKCKFLVNCTSVKLISYMTNIFAVGDLSENSSSLCLFVQNEWREVKKLLGHGWLGVAVEEFIYLINSANQMKRFVPRHGNCLLEDLTNFPKKTRIEHLCSFDFFVLAFSSEIIDETAVHCLDTMSQTWKQLDRLNGSAKNIVSFRREKQLYILQSNGNLWIIKKDETNGVNLNLVEVLWQGTSNVNGVIYINEHLCFILSEKETKNEPFSVTSKLFVNIQLFSEAENRIWSNIVPAVIKLQPR